MGMFTIDAAGQWVYILDDNNPTVQALNAGATLTLATCSPPTTIDCTTQPVTITITGANDVAAISGDITGTVTEAGGVNNGTPPLATGDLTSADVDNPGDGWQAVPAGAATAKGFGTYALRHPAWVRTYTLDNSNPYVQALNVGDAPTSIALPSPPSTAPHNSSPSPSTAPTTPR